MGAKFYHMLGVVSVLNGFIKCLSVNLTILTITTLK